MNRPRFKQRDADSEKFAAMKDLLQSDYCAGMLRVLADPERLRIIQCLREGSKTVSEIGASTDTAMGNASHHLKVLRQAGLVEAQREGRFVRYQLATHVIVPAKSGHVEFLDIGCCRLEIPKPGK